MFPRLFFEIPLLLLFLLVLYVAIQNLPPVEVDDLVIGADPELLRSPLHHYLRPVLTLCVLSLLFLRLQSERVVIVKLLFGLYNWLNIGVIFKDVLLF